MLGSNYVWLRSQPSKTRAFMVGAAAHSTCAVRCCPRLCLHHPDACHTFFIISDSRPTLSDFMNDAWFHKTEVPRTAPYTIYPPGPQRQLAQERQLRDREVVAAAAAAKRDKGFGVEKPREPLKPITNLVGGAEIRDTWHKQPNDVKIRNTKEVSPRLVSSSPRTGTRTTSPRNPRADLDHLVGRRAGSERDYYRDRELLPPPLKRELPNGLQKPFLATYGLHPAPAADRDSPYCATPASTLPACTKTEVCCCCCCCPRPQTQFPYLPCYPSLLSQTSATFGPRLGKLVVAYESHLGASHGKVKGSVGGNESGNTISIPGRQRHRRGPKGGAR